MKTFHSGGLPKSIHAFYAAGMIGIGILIALALAAFFSSQGQHSTTVPTPAATHITSTPR